MDKERSVDYYKVYDAGAAGKYGIVAGRWYRLQLLALINEKLMTEVGSPLIQASQTEEGWEAEVKRMCRANEVAK